MNIIITYKIIHGLVSILFSDLLRIVIQQLDLMVTNSCVILILARLHSFTQRVANDLNSLPANIVDAPDVVKFNNLWDRLWSYFCYILHCS